MKREYEDYLHDMLENAEKALSFVEGLDHEGFRVQKMLSAPRTAQKLALEFAAGTAARHLRDGGGAQVGTASGQNTLCFWTHDNH